MSTSNVVELHDPMRRQWRAIEADLRTCFVSVGVVGVELEHVLAVLQPIFMRYAAPVAADPLNPLASVNEWASRMAVGFLTHVGARELALRRAGVPE